MGKKYKLNVTRPEFLLQMMTGGDVNQLDDDNMRRALHDTNALSYVVYTVLMEANPKKVDMSEVSNDGEAIAIRFDSKSTAKKISAECRESTVRYGRRLYAVHTKVRDEYIIFTTDDVTPDDEPDNEEEFEDEES